MGFLISSGSAMPSVLHVLCGSSCSGSFVLYSACPDVAKIFQRTPYIANLKPGGDYVAKDFGEAGGVPMLMKTLHESGLINGDCLTVTGQTWAEYLEDIEWDPNQLWIAIEANYYRLQDALRKCVWDFFVNQTCSTIIIVSCKCLLSSFSV